MHDSSGDTEIFQRNPAILNGGDEALVGLSNLPGDTSTYSATVQPAFGMPGKTFQRIILGTTLLFSCVTAPVKFPDLRDNPAVSNSSSFVWSAKASTAKRISLRTARLIAQQISANREQSLKEDRNHEARMALSYWEDDGDAPA